MDTISKQVELRFWNIAIPVLTRSSLVRFIIRKGYRLYSEKTLSLRIATGLVIACAGFASGMLAFSVMMFLQ